MDYVTKSVLTVDVVSFSTKALEEQVKASRALIKLLKFSMPAEPKDDQKENNRTINGEQRRIWSPGGDGGSMTFWKSNIEAINSAINLAKLVKQYNRLIVDKEGLAIEKIDNRLSDPSMPKCNEPLELRIGIHAGPVIKEQDFDNRENIWGFGINISNRVAAFGEPSQIVVSHEYYKQTDLDSYDEKYKIDYIGKFYAKHDVPIEIYNVQTKDGSAGIPASKIDEWYTLLHHPLKETIKSYSVLLNNVEPSSGFRAFVLAKRVMDLCYDKELEAYKLAIEKIKVLSKNAHRIKGPGKRKEFLIDPFFSQFSDDALLYLCQHTKFKTFADNDTLIEEGEIASSLMIIISGVIELLIGGKKIPNVTLEEGDIIGEMGLFNPAGGKRNATLRALKDSIVLVLDYEYLQLDSKCEIVGLSNTQIIKEIRALIWELYSNRTKDNQIIDIHKLFRMLKKDERKKIADQSKFYPVKYDDNIRLKPEDCWDYLILVVEGQLSVITQKSNNLTFYKDEIFGAIRLLVGSCPYSKVTVAKNTHLICIPWEIIDELCDRHDLFEEQCIVYAGKERRKMDKAQTAANEN